MAQVIWSGGVWDEIRNMWVNGQGTRVVRKAGGVHKHSDGTRKTKAEKKLEKKERIAAKLAVVLTDSLKKELGGI